MQYGFGVGNLTLVPPAGSADVTPRQVGILRDVTVDITKTTKELKGQYLFPVDVAAAGGNITGKAKYAQISGGLIASLLTGSSTTPASMQKFRDKESHAAAASVTITPPGSGTFVEDAGVIDTNGKEMTKVAATPTVGQYSQSGAAYTFNASETGTVYISYIYSVTSGKTIDYDNQLMGSSTVYALALFNTFRNKSFGLRLYAVTCPKLTFALKNEDYNESDLDFQAFQDATGNICTFYVEE